ncbi:MAG: chitobiase/beta-hexosaminidase C-terminal domain-containing protein [Bacteroidaceae bacterium]|nr:chitobiase/beta-hexosaminidase C-terminal domain-containing protein [Bacteroidaceae bacterium]
MKKFLLSLAVLAFSCASAFAEDVVMKYFGTTTTNLKADGSNEAGSVGLDDAAWSVVADKGGNSNAPGLNKAGDIRLYYHKDGSNTITVKSLTNATINSIAITFTDAQYSNVSVTVDGNAVTGTDCVFEINSTSFVLSNANTENIQVRISQIVISYTGGAPISVLPPKFSVESGMYFEPQTVALTCETEGAKILYTIPAGQDPEYTDDDNYTGVFYDGTPLTISKTTTIKAMAVKDGKVSSIVTATYTIVTVEHAGTEADPFTVADALVLIDALANGATTSETYYVKGVVVGTPDIQKKDDGTFYGNANFDIADDANGSTLTAYRLKGLENSNIESSDYIKEGDAVILKGQLQKYVKGDTVTPEIKNGYIYSLTSVPTGINAAKVANKAAVIFNAAGQQLSAPQKGINIIGGKKVFLK